MVANCSGVAWRWPITAWATSWNDILPTVGCCAGVVVPVVVGARVGGGTCR